jgi:deoxycytidylate deaminase
MKCAKQITTCKIITTDGREFNGENYCLVPQLECPRLEGEGYEKCKSICFQIGHAEEVAIMHALHAGANLKGATAIIGHDRVCANCSNLLTSHGITTIKLTGSPRRPK